MDHRHKFLRVAGTAMPLSPLSTLPAGLQRFCTQLAGESGASPESVVMACLWTLMQAAVPGSKLYADGLEIPVTDGAGSLFLIHQDTKAPNALLQRILQPVMRAQAALVTTSEAINANKLALREAQLKRMYDQIVKRDCFPDQAHLYFLRAELDLIRARRQQLLVIQDPSPPQLEVSMSLFLDNAPAVVMTDVRSSAAILDQLEKMHPEDAGAVTEPPKPASPGLQAPPALTTPRRGSATAVLAGCDLKFIEPALNRWGGLFRNAFFLNVGNAPGNSSPAITAEVELWDELVRRAFAPRLAHSHPVWRLTPEAASALHQGAEAIMAAQKSTASSYALTGLAGMCGRLALALHACSGSPGRNISHAIVGQALELLQWLIAEREALLHASLASTQAEQEAKAEAVMLEKLRRHGGPVRRRDLYRMYDSQRRQIHDPVLARLLQKGTVSADKAGSIYPSEPAAQPANPPRFELRTY